MAKDKTIKKTNFKVNQHVMKNKNNDNNSKKLKELKLRKNVIESIIANIKKKIEVLKKTKKIKSLKISKSSNKNGIVEKEKGSIISRNKAANILLSLSKGKMDIISEEETNKIIPFSELTEKNSRELKRVIDTISDDINDMMEKSTKTTNHKKLMFKTSKSKSDEDSNKTDEGKEIIEDEKEEEREVKKTTGLLSVYYYLTGKLSQATMALAKATKEKIPLIKSIIIAILVFIKDCIVVFAKSSTRSKAIFLVGMFVFYKSNIYAKYFIDIGLIGVNMLLNIANKMLNITGFPSLFSKQFYIDTITETGRVVGEQVFSTVNYLVNSLASLTVVQTIGQTVYDMFNTFISTVAANTSAIQTANIATTTMTNTIAASTAASQNTMLAVEAATSTMQQLSTNTKVLQQAIANQPIQNAISQYTITAATAAGVVTKKGLNILREFLPGTGAGRAANAAIGYSGVLDGGGSRNSSRSRSKGKSKGLKLKSSTYKACLNPTLGFGLENIINKTRKTLKIKKKDFCIKKTFNYN